MSLIQRIRLLLFGVVLAACVGSLLLGVAGARHLLRDHAAERNVQDAAALARALAASDAGGEAGAQMLLALFDAGAYRRIRLTDAAGQVRFERQAASMSRAPDGFARWAGLEAAPGRAALDGGATASHGAIEVVRAAGPLVDDLWEATLRLAAGLALLAAAILALGLMLTGRLRHQLDSAIAQAESLQRGDYQTAAESSVPEMRRLTRAMNAMAGHLRQVFEAHTTQVSLIRMEATRDPLTGLANRLQFLQQLESAAARPAASGSGIGGLVFLRLLDIGAVNRTLGHPATDRIIRVIAQTLQTYTRRVDGCFIGRLNGSDFALSLPAPGLARETADAVMEMLGAALPAFGGGVAVVAGAVESAAGADASTLMRAADRALRLAQSNGAFAVESAPLEMATGQQPPEAAAGDPGRAPPGDG